MVVDNGCTGRVKERAEAQDVGGSDGAGCAGTYLGFLWDVHKIRAMTEDDRAVAWISIEVLGGSSCRGVPSNDRCALFGLVGCPRMAVSLQLACALVAWS